MSFRDPKWRDLQAGEYVLGTLSASETAEFEDVLHYDRELQNLVVSWQEELQPLANAMQSIEPPLYVWHNIVDAVQQDRYATDRHRFAERRPPIRQKHKLQNEKTSWQIFGSLATAASVVLGMMLWGQYQQPEPYLYDAVSVLSAEDNKPLWIVDVSVKDQKLRITTIGPPAIDESQDHQLWMIKPDNGGVLSLGLLPRITNTTIVLEADGIAANAVALAVSLEPAGGSKQPGPSGPVLYQGSFNTLSEL